MKEKIIFLRSTGNNLNKEQMEFLREKTMHLIGDPLEILILKNLNYY